VATFLTPVQTEHFGSREPVAEQVPHPARPLRRAPQGFGMGSREGERDYECESAVGTGHRFRHGPD